MYSFTGRNEGTLVGDSAGAWNEYYGSLDAAFVLDTQQVVKTEELDEVEAAPSARAEPSQYQPSLYAFFKPSTAHPRPLATPMQQLLQDLNPSSPKKRRWAATQGWREREQAKKEPAIVVGHRVEALPGTEYSDNEVQFYIAGDQGTVEELDMDTEGDARFTVVWDRSGKMSFMMLSQHVLAPKFKVIGKAEFFVGHMVQRRDEGRDWGIGVVTSTRPLLVTVLDTPGAAGYEWDEVRQIPEVELLEDDGGCCTPSIDDVKDSAGLPTPKKRCKISQAEAKQLAQVRKDASISYLRSATTAQ